MTPSYRIPATATRSEIVIRRSRFVTTIQRASTVNAARGAIADLRSEMPTANHHVYAFRVGFGKTVTEGMSDDGEPTGTAGPPTLAVVRGSDVGDLALVTARYFGGTKLGTGGLVRAYTESAQLALSQLKTEFKVERQLVGIDLPYSLYNIVKRLIASHNGVIVEEVFEADVLITVRFKVADLKPFAVELRERSSGAVTPVQLD